MPEALYSTVTIRVDRSCSRGNDNENPTVYEPNFETSAATLSMLCWCQQPTLPISYSRQSFDEKRRRNHCNGQVVSRASCIQIYGVYEDIMEGLKWKVVQRHLSVLELVTCNIMVLAVEIRA